MRHLRKVEDLLLSKPGLFILKRENLDSNLFTAQMPFPYSSKPSASLDLKQLYGPKTINIEYNRIYNESKGLQTT